MVEDTDDGDDLSDEWARKVVQIWNERGHAGAAAHNDTLLKGSKAAVEACWAIEWQQAAMDQLGLHIQGLEMNGSDPPDAYATIAGARVSVELAELVDGALIAGLKVYNRYPEVSGRSLTSHNDPFFTAAQWTRERFIGKLNHLLDSKDRRYAARDLVFDYLVIYSAEPWLSAGDIGAWLAAAPFARRDCLRNVHLLLDYQPGNPGCHPIFRVY